MTKKHRFFYRLFYPLVVLFARLTFGYTCRKAENLPENYIVLSNHTTDFDPLLVAASFPRPMYFVGSEHIARWGLLYRFLRFAFSPIMRYKGTLAASAVAEVLRRARAGANICLFAEGSRSWDGVTAPILPSTGKMVKGARCALVTYRIQGGYFVSPRWGGSSIRRGRLHGAPVAVYTREQLAAMSAGEVNAAIARDLYEDAYATQRGNPQQYRSKRGAENLEDFLFLCPRCEAVDALRSRGSTAVCQSCGLELRYDACGMLHGAPMDTLRELSLWLWEKTRETARRGGAYTAGSGTLTTVSRHRETPAARGPITMSAEALTCGECSIPMGEILNLDMHGRRSIVFSTGNAYYELIPDRPYSAYKFQLLYNAFRAPEQNNQT